MSIIDQNVLQFFAENRTGWLSFLMLTTTYAGGYLVASIVTALASLSFLAHHHSKRILALLISIVGSSLTVFLLKNIFNEARPLISQAFYLETTPSFPSGHASIAVALYGFLLYIICKYDKHPLKNIFVIFLAVLIVLIGVSRLYLGVHYLSDVLGGYIIGAFWLALAVRVVKSKF